MEDAARTDHNRLCPLRTPQRRGAGLAWTPSDGDLSRGSGANPNRPEQPIELLLRLRPWPGQSQEGQDRQVGRRTGSADAAMPAAQPGLRDQGAQTTAKPEEAINRRAAWIAVWAHRNTDLQWLALSCVRFSIR